MHLAFKLSIVFLFCKGFLIYAQKDNFHFKHLSTAQGLLDNSVRAIIQDRQGLMWLGTPNGLNTYDGVNVEAFISDPKDSLTISSNTILSLLEDKEGFLWVGTYDGLNKYNSETKTFKRYKRKQKNETSLINDVVICSTEMPNGELWFGTGNGISIYNKAQDNFYNVYYKENQRNNPDLRAIKCIFPDSAGNVWIATEKGLVKLKSRENNNFHFQAYNWDALNEALFVQDIIELRPGILGIATKYNGFLLFNTKTHKFNYPSFYNALGKLHVRLIQMANDGNLWLATTNGAYVITPKKRVIHVTENQNTLSDISQNFIESIYKDRSGSIWLGTHSGGVNIWHKTNENFVRFKNSEVKNNVVTSILADTDTTNIFFGTEGGTINMLDEDGTISKLFKIPNDDSPISYTIQTLYKTSYLLWVGVLDHGILIYDLKTKKQRFDIISDELQALLKNTGVLTIKGAANGDLWIGTFGKGVIRYNTITKTLLNVRRPKIRSNIVRTIAIDKDNVVWLGCLGAVNTLTFSSDTAFKVSKYLNKDRFTRFSIKTIYAGQDNNIWVGTNTKGLYKFTGKEFKKVHLNVKDRIAEIYTIVEDNKGFIWITTSKGIVKHNPKTRHSIIYDQKSEISTNEFNANSGIITKDNYIYFGGIKGVTVFNPQKLYKDRYAPKVLLSSLKIKNKTISINDESGILSKNINHTQTIELNHNNSNFSINYALPNFLNPEQNKYAYRLRGLDEDWIYTNKTEVFYTLQTAGTYVFEVKGGNHDGVWNPETTTLEIQVHPAPWLSWWAITLYSLFVIFALYGLYWILQSRSRLRHRLQLEFIESKRNDDLNKAKLEFFTNISHEFRTPLTLIAGPLQQILKHYDGNAKMYRKLKVIEGSANHLLRLINRLMDFRKLEQQQFKLQAAEGNIVKFVHEIFLSFKEHAKIGDYNYNFHAPDDVLMVYFDRYKLERVFYNLISNAFRYTKNGGTITLRITKTNTHVVIALHDSGVGIAEEHIDKIFDRFFEVAIHNKPDDNYNKGTGIGLSIAHNIVKLHHGTIEVENVKPHGALFTVKLKLGADHLSEEEILQDFKLSDEVSQYVTQLEATQLVPKAEDALADLASAKKKYTLLIAEDNTLLRSFMKELLKKDYNVLQAENGTIALEKAKQHLPDLIISDVVMPEMVGTDLCAKIKEDIKTSHIPVILLTSRTSLIYKFEGLESGADDYISKPFDIREFQLRIKNILDSRGRLRQKFASGSNFKAEEIALTTADETLLKKAFEIVETHIDDENFDIETFALQLGVSRSLLFTKIKAWTNFTPNEFIREVRLNYAAKLLETKGIRVSEVSVKVGFKRAKYFSQCFQKKYGVTPSQFAEQLGNR